MDSRTFVDGLIQNLSEKYNILCHCGFCRKGQNLKIKTVEIFVNLNFFYI